MSNVQRELARHALGLTNGRTRTYRNHFVTGRGAKDYDDWKDMVSAGLATRRAGNVLTGGDDLFRLTRAGAELALNDGEQLDPHDLPTPPRERSSWGRA